MLEILQIPFMQRALISGIVLAALLSILGVFVVLRRMSFFSEGIAHASLAGVALGIITSTSPLLIALISAIFFAVLIFFLEDKYKLTSDTAIGIIFTSGMALGVLLISISPNYQPELMSFLFGNILAITWTEIYLVIIFSFLILAFVFKYLKQLIISSLDKEIAYTSGIKVKRLQLAVYIFLSIAVVLGSKILGIILISALLIMPVAISKLFSKSFKSLMIKSVIFSEIIVIGGIFMSYYIDIPTGPTIVLFGTTIFIFSSILKLFRSR